MLLRYLKTICIFAALLAAASPVFGARLFVGAVSTDITPPKPVALAGQHHLRISKRVETPLTANVVVVESREGDRSLDLAVMVSCDVICVPTEILAMVREKVAEQLPELETTKIFLGGTHTHTAPELRLNRWLFPKEDAMRAEEYREFFAKKVADAIVEAWKARTPGSVTWGLSDAVVAQNRRAVYADGSAQMYGRTNKSAFRGLEGYEDHDINTLFFWNEAGSLVAIAVNVSCPSQEVEHRRAVNADFWHPVREALHKRYGADVCVLGMCGAAGDQSPHVQYRKAAEQRMRRLRGLNNLDEIARRIARAVDEAHEIVKDDRHADVPFMHRAETVALPMRLVTEAEYAEAKREHAEAKRAYAKVAANVEKDLKTANHEHRRMLKCGWIIDRFERQKTDPTLPVELHVLRIGDVAICTNPFELYTEFGIRIKGRSKASQTFVVQLVGPGKYLPTAQAVRGGHYSTQVSSNLVGPEGGQVLVDKTVELINSMWAGSK